MNEHYLCSADFPSSLIASAGEPEQEMIQGQRDFQIGSGSDVLSHSFQCANDIDPPVDFLLI